MRQYGDIDMWTVEGDNATDAHLTLGVTAARWRHHRTIIVTTRN